MDTRVKPAYDGAAKFRIHKLFFALSKTLGVLLLPSNFLIVLGIVGVALLFTRFAARGRALATASLVLLALFGFTSLGNLLLYPLEARFPPWDAGRGAPDGIVVLGGPINPELSAERGLAVFSGGADRLITAAALAHRYRDARLIYSGGNANLVAGDASKEADYALSVFESLGIAPQRLIMERRSRNTQENAEFSKVLAAPKPGERWLLVTSAYHMPRAIGVFRAAGFAVEACPADWRTGAAPGLLSRSVFASDGLGNADTAIREWIGLVAYRVSGKTSELFPGP